jgi:hypothetical protein
MAIDRSNIVGGQGRLKKLQESFEFIEKGLQVMREAIAISTLKLEQARHVLFSYTTYAFMDMSDDACDPTSYSLDLYVLPCALMRSHM